VTTLTSSTVASTPTINPLLDKALRKLIARARPRRLIETGTHLGLGSTLTICQALADNGLSFDQFYSIEVNPDFYAQAWTNLASEVFIRGFCGTVDPRSLLPSEADLRREMTEQAAAAVRRETYIPDALDDLLGFVLANLD
jgi:hypothetical protein